MCQFLSFVVVRGRNGMSVRAASTLSDQSEIYERYDLDGKTYNECEWVVDKFYDTIEVRDASPRSDYVKEKVEGWIRKNWPTRQQLTNHLIEQMISEGFLPQAAICYDGHVFGQKRKLEFLVDMANYMIKDLDMRGHDHYATMFRDVVAKVSSVLNGEDSRTLGLDALVS